MTYHVIHPDGRKDGPATDLDLRMWLREGRIGPDAMVEDESGARKPLAEWPGFEDAATVEPAAKAGSATARLEMTVSPGRAWLVPTVIGLAVACAGFVLLSAVLFPVFARTRLQARQTATLIGMRRLGAGVLMYAGDNDDRLPPAMKDVASVRPLLEMYVGDEKIGTENPEGGTILGNEGIAGKSVWQLGKPGAVVLFYESKAWGDGRRAVCRLDGRASMEKSFDPATGLKTAPKSN